jgi:hypothetical protein
MVVGMVVAGCQQTAAPRLNAPPHGTAEQTADLQGTFEHMIDNALLTDMTISDIHFVPQRSMLNSLGEQRLARMAGLMESYGGAVRFNTREDDEDLVERRVDSIIAFLADEGIDTSTQVLNRELPGGYGVDATQAILIKAHEATYKPKKEKSESFFNGGGN